MPLLKIDWSSVPNSAFTAKNTDLARQLKCTPENVRLERIRRKLQPHSRGSGPATGPHKVTLKLSRRSAARLTDAARRASLTESAYVLALIDGASRLMGTLSALASDTTAREFHAGEAAAYAHAVKLLREYVPGFPVPAPDSIAESPDLSGSAGAARYN